MGPIQSLPCLCAVHPQMTTNCISEPRKTYADRIFTTGEVGWAGVAHIEGEMGKTKDYSAVIQKAMVRAGRGVPAGCGQGMRWQRPPPCLCSSQPQGGCPPHPARPTPAPRAGAARL